MTDYKNVKAEHVRYVNELLKIAQDTLIIGKAFGAESERMKRWRMKRTVEEDTRPAYYDIEFKGPWTVAGMREWLDVVDTLSKELGIEPSLEADYDASFTASWESAIPYTQEEKEQAKAWLEANPEPAEPKTIQWRRNIPFTVDYGTARGNEDDAEPF